MTSLHQPGPRTRVAAVGAVLAVGAVALSASCAGSAPTAAPVATSTKVAAPATTHRTGGTTVDARTVTNTWVANGTVDPRALPLGDGRTSTTTPAIGSVFNCAGGGGVGGATVVGPWIDGSTFDSTAKVHVSGDITWPSADLTITVDHGTRTISTNDLPVTTHTGTFPISSADPAHTYDQNPNRITARSSTVALPAQPVAAPAPGCLPMGAIGVLANGVFLFNALDGQGRDAVAHETQDLCDGHPAPGDQYHYHDIPSCLLDASTGPSTLIGWANDGFPVYVERDGAGNLPTDADLDECHGRTGPVVLEGQVVSTYHYSATLEFPYTLGCFHGTNAVKPSGPRPPR